MGNDSSQPQKYGERLDNDITVNWKKIPCENPFAPREAHCSCALNSKLFVFGGVTQTEEDEALETNDLLVFDTGEVEILTISDREWVSIQLLGVTALDG